MKTKTQKIIILKGDLVTPSEAKRMSDLDLVTYRNNAKAIIKELSENLAETVDPVLFERADKYPERKYGVANNTVVIVNRPNFNKVSISFAKKHNATKLVPDSDVLKVMWNNKQQIPGVIETEYVTVK